MSKFNISCAVAALTISASLSSSAQANVVWDQGFETGTDGWFDNGGSITRVASGTDGIPSASGSYHGKVNAAGPFSRFDGYRYTFGGGYEASVNIYLDTGWAAGQGFDYTVASSNQTVGVNGHLRDFIFHVTKDTSTGLLLIGGTNNTNGVPREDLETLPGYATITAAGWYSFKHVFRDAGNGSLAVDLIVTDSSDSPVFQTTRNNAADLLATVVGGNRYAWFTANTIAAGVNIDNHSLNLVPEPATLGLLGLAGLALGRRRR